MRFPLQVLTAAVLGIATLSPAFSQPVSTPIGTADGLVTRPSKYSVAETIDRFESTVRSTGDFQIFARVDFQAFAATQGGKVRPSQLSIFGGGRALQPLLPDTPKAAIDLPLKVLAWEDDHGKVWVTYNTGEYLKERHPIKGNEDVLKRMTDVTAALVKRAVE
jgi:uncharacterized protein (DUF302 family)